MTDYSHCTFIFTPTRIHSCMHTSAPTHTQHECAYSDDHEAKQIACIVLASSEHTWLIHCGSSLGVSQCLPHSFTVKQVKYNRSVG